MSTTFGVKVPGIEDPVEVAFRSSGGMIWKNDLAIALSNETPVIALDNTAQGIYTIGDIRREITALGMKAGDYVCYMPERGVPENGRIKRIGSEHAFVVYNCNNEWHRYTDFTAASTEIISLVPGWFDAHGNQIPVPEDPTEL